MSPGIAAASCGAMCDVECAEAQRARLDSAERLDDLRVPPGNRLEALVGDRKGEHRISDQRSMSDLLSLGRGGAGAGRDCRLPR